MSSDPAPKRKSIGFTVQVTVPCGDTHRNFDEAVSSVPNPPDDFPDDAGDIRRTRCRARAVRPRSQSLQSAHSEAGLNVCTIGTRRQ